jgi:hypothetical protein
MPTAARVKMSFSAAFEQNGVVALAIGFPSMAQ